MTFYTITEYVAVFLFAFTFGVFLTIDWPLVFGIRRKEER